MSEIKFEEGEKVCCLRQSFNANENKLKMYVAIVDEIRGSEEDGFKYYVRYNRRRNIYDEWVSADRVSKYVKKNSGHKAGTSRLPGNLKEVIGDRVVSENSISLHGPLSTCKQNTEQSENADDCVSGESAEFITDRSDDVSSSKNDEEPDDIPPQRSRTPSEESQENCGVRLNEIVVIDDDARADSFDTTVPEVTKQLTITKPSILKTHNQQGKSSIDFESFVKKRIALETQPFNFVSLSIAANSTHVSFENKDSDTIDTVDVASTSLTTEKNCSINTASNNENFHVIADCSESFGNQQNVDDITRNAHILEQVLFKDYHTLNVQKKLAKIPDKITVQDIVESYIAFKKLSTAENKEASIQFAFGIVHYFDFVLEKRLLYECERQQYFEIKKKFDCVPTSKLYGLRHLIRLMFKLDGFLAFAFSYEKSNIYWERERLELFEYLAEYQAKNIHLLECYYE